jgi:Transposase IS66 family
MLYARRQWWGSHRRWQRGLAGRKEAEYAKKSWTQDRVCALVPLMMSLPKLPEIPDDERTPLVVALLEIIQLQQEQIQMLKDEIARLKGQSPRPKIKPSSLEQDPKKKKRKKDKRPGSARRRKRGVLEIHETKVIEVDNVPSGSQFKGYEDFTVQGLVIEPHNVRYRRARWETPQGDTLVAVLPEEVRALGGHFDCTVVSFIEYQYHHAHVTQPLILEQLREFGVDISAGQVNHILTEGHDRFHAEKDEILRVGLEVSSYVNVDDTGARHQGKNGYCTHIGNELFAWFQSTGSKSRINFFELLRAGHEDYVLNAKALEYMRAHQLPAEPLQRLSGCIQRSFPSHASWLAGLAALGITSQRHIRIATEGALLGCVLEGINPDLVIVSDDAPQFNVLLHALCWIHAERTLTKLLGFNDEQRAALEEIRTQIWDHYQDLKAYRAEPSAAKKAELETRFDEIFTTRTCFSTLNHALKRLNKNKAELLRVLERPEIPLHNNTSEQDIREYVKKRKISGSTRSENGRRCRDTFASLKKTCRKLGISFWQFLKDRLSGRNTIAPLPEVIRLRAAEAYAS